MLWTPDSNQEEKLARKREGKEAHLNRNVGLKTDILDVWQAWEREETNIWETVIRKGGNGTLASVGPMPLQLSWKGELRGQGKMK